MRARGLKTFNAGLNPPPPRRSTFLWQNSRDVLSPCLSLIAGFLLHVREKKERGKTSALGRAAAQPCRTRRSIGKTVISFTARGLFVALPSRKVNGYLLKFRLFCCPCLDGLEVFAERICLIIFLINIE